MTANGLFRLILSAVEDTSAAHASTHLDWLRSAEVLRRAMTTAGEWTAADAAALATELEFTPTLQAYYDALVSLVRGEGVTEPLLEGRGNFGRAGEGNPPAYPTYTDCRLTEVGRRWLRCGERDRTPV